MRNLAFVVVQALVTACIWLGAGAAIGVTLATVLASHVSKVFFDIALIFGAFGAAGEVGYLLVERVWARPHWPRWLLLGIWTTIAPTVALVAIEMVHHSTTDLAEFAGVLLTWSVIPAFVIAYFASWPFRASLSER